MSLDGLEGRVPAPELAGLQWHSAEAKPAMNQSSSIIHIKQNLESMCLLSQRDLLREADIASRFSENGQKILQCLYMTLQVLEHCDLGLARR